MSKQAWEHIGVCGVDSGQLMVCDPCYIDGQWTKEGPVFTNRVYRDTVTGKLWRWGDDKNADFFHWDTALYACDGRTPNEMVACGQWVEEPQTNPMAGQFNYAGCCAATCSTKLAGQLNFSRGHAGAGVTFSSGYGDGCYPVYARRDKHGRIIEVRIKMS